MGIRDQCLSLLFITVQIGILGKVLKVRCVVQRTEMTFITEFSFSQHHLEKKLAQNSAGAYRLIWSETALNNTERRERNLFVFKNKSSCRNISTSPSRRCLFSFFCILFFLKQRQRGCQSADLCVSEWQRQGLKRISESDIIWTLFEIPVLCFADGWYSRSEKLQRHFYRIERTLSPFSFWHACYDFVL